jgi:hypothetical protein
MAERTAEMSPSELHDDTLSVLEKELESMDESTLEEETLDVKAESEPEPEPVEEPKTDIDTPTYKEAQTAQQAPADTEDDRQETSTETVSASEGDKEKLDLSDEDSEVYGNLKPKAQERFEHWINRSKELEVENTTLKDAGALQDYIVESNTNADQLDWSLNVFKSLNSGNYDEAVKALKAIDQFADKVGETLGVNKKDNDEASYSDFEDLSGAVENMEISEDWATKLAQERIGQNSRYQAESDFNKTQTVRTNQQNAYVRNQEKALSSITDWEKELEKSDPDYAMKKDMMVDIGKDIVQSNFPPENWLNMLQSQYNVLSRGMTVAAQANGNASKSVRPLAPNRSGGGASNPLDISTPEVTPEFLQAHLDAMNS